jgi:hypothetical protein
MFRRADSLTKQTDSQRLLTLLIKIPLFYILEELTLKYPEFAKRYVDEIYNPKPLSDGAFASILHALIGDVISNDDVKLVVFSGLIIALSNGYLQNIKVAVEARNRAGHSPFDWTSFIANCDDIAPSMISILRSGLSDIDILQVRSLSVCKEGKFVKAYRLVGPDRIYETIIFKTNEKLENYPEDALVAYNRSKDKAVILGGFFNSHQVPVSVINISIFDRISEANEPMFTDI